MPQTSSESDTESLRFEDLQVIQSFKFKVYLSFIFLLREYGLN